MAEKITAPSGVCHTTGAVVVLIVLFSLEVSDYEGGIGAAEAERVGEEGVEVV